MDHRWSRRQHIQGEVVLAAAGRRPQAVRLSDLSLGGLGVDGLETGLPVDVFVTVSFSVGQAEDASHHRVLAQVVHRREHQAGLLFIDPGYETLQALRSVLTQPPRGGAPVLSSPVTARPAEDHRAPQHLTTWR